MTNSFLPRLSILAGALLTLAPGCGSDSGGETGTSLTGLTETDTAATADETGTTDATGTTTGDGDGDSGDGDSGDGDSGDGDSGDGDSGDGDSGDGDSGDGDSGDGDSGDGDSGDGDTGDGDGDGDGDPCMSDEDCPDGDICNEATGECQTDCGTAMVQLANPPPPVMLVLDKSGSMVSNSWDHDNDGGTADQTRWETLYNVTDFLLTNFESSISFGLQLFPSANATTVCANSPTCLACDVAGAPEVGLAIDNRTAILAGMPGPSANSSTVAGATPAAGGMVSAKAALDVAIANGEQGAAFILITDGAANCGLQWANEPCVFPGDNTSASCELMDYFDDELEPLIEGYYTNEGIPTYVVGIDIQDEILDPLSEYNFKVDNTNVYDELNSIAEAGGVPQMGGSESFYNATNEAELQAAFEAIAGELATCDIDLSEAPNTPPLPAQIPYVEFSMMNMTVPGPLSISEAECDMGVQNGWIWVVEGISVRFCGSFCDMLLAEGEVDGIYGCPMGG